MLRVLRVAGSVLGGLQGGPVRHDQTIGNGPEGRWSGEVVGDEIVWTPRAEDVAGQMSLLADTAGPVRPTDPDTSAEAAALPGRGTQRWRVLVALWENGPANDERLARLLNIDKGSAAKRRGELAQAGLVEADTTPRGAVVYTKTEHGARAIVWRLTAQGRSEALRP